MPIHSFLHSFKDSIKDKLHHHSHHKDESAEPPAWTPAPEASHQYGLWNEAPEEEYEAAEKFCAEYPPQVPRLLSSVAVERINQIGAAAWGIEHPTSPRFTGSIQNPGDRKTGPDDDGTPALVRVQTRAECKAVCLLSDLPIVAGLYDAQGKEGVYYEVRILRMDGIIAIGTACRPYPAWRLPGWNRLSAGLHLDDFRKFFEDPNGGRDYDTSASGLKLDRVRPGDTVGCGYEFATGVLFFTYNGKRLPPAFTGIYLPKQQHDVFAAVGVEGACDLEVNFGGDYFRWKASNDWAWKVEGQVGQMSGPAPSESAVPSYTASQARPAAGASFGFDDPDALPSYNETRGN